MSMADQERAVSLPLLESLGQCTLQASESLFFLRITIHTTLSEDLICIQPRTLIRGLNLVPMVGPVLVKITKIDASRKIHDRNLTAIILRKGTRYLILLEAKRGGRSLPLTKLGGHVQGFEIWPASFER